MDSKKSLDGQQKDAAAVRITLPARADLNAQHEKNSLSIPPRHPSKISRKQKGRIRGDYTKHYTLLAKPAKTRVCKHYKRHYKSPSTRPNALHASAHTLLRLHKQGLHTLRRFSAQKRPGFPRSLAYLLVFLLPNQKGISLDQLTGTFVNLLH